MRLSPNRLLENVVDRLETADVLDAIADRAVRLVSPMSQSERLRSALSGSHFGHPAHPALVAVPMGSWLAASYLDAAGGPAGRRAARALVGFGLATALPAALTGASDWSYTTGAERRVGFVHAAGNFGAIALYAGSWFVRRRVTVAGPVLAAAGLAAVSATGWLGGHLSYARGVGVDTTAFDVAAADWTDVLRIDSLVDNEPTMVRAAGLPLLLVRVDGEIRALADRCTHRGAPLHEGSIEDGCVICPWHASAFRLRDGAVRVGPATRPQPAYEVRTRHGSIQVRRAAEPGSLRTNPVS